MKFSRAVLAFGLWFAASTLGQSLWSKLKPAELWLGPEIGMARSHLETSQEVAALLTPTPESAPNSVSPVFGGSVQAVWARHFSLTLAARREIFSLTTSESSVSFPNNPFPHTLSSRTRLTYNVWPVLMGLHLGSPRHSWVLQAGLYRAYLDDATLSWTVDGEPYSHTPDPQFRRRENGYFFATEFSSQWGRGQWKVGISSRRTQESLTEGWRGRLDMEAAQIILGYRWNLLASAR